MTRIRANRDRRAEYEKSKDAVKRRVKAWVAANPERVRAYSRNYAHRPDQKDKSKANSLKWRTEHRERDLLGSARRRAKKQGIPFAIDVSDIVIPATCPLLGIPLHRAPDGRRNPNAPSVDKIDPTKGYVKGNVWVISLRANRMKSSARPEELLAFAHGIINVIKYGPPKGGASSD